MTQQEIEQANLAKLAEQEKQAAAQEAEKKAAVEAAKLEAESVYKQENERLAKENLEKSDALLVERSRRKEADEKAEAAKTAAEALAEANKNAEAAKGLSVEEIDSLLETKLAKREVEQRLLQTSSDPEEQKLVRFHYDNSIVKSGNVAEDLKKASAIANQHLVEKAKQEQFEREQGEGQMAGFQGGRPTGRSGKPAYETNPTLKGAAALLDKLGVGDAKKYLK